MNKRLKAQTNSRRGKQQGSGAPRVPCDPSRLAPYNSYGQPVFVERGYYEDLSFRCIDCGVEQLWLATQQQWWYEVAKGHVEATAVRCRPCRRRINQCKVQTAEAQS